MFKNFRQKAMRFSPSKSRHSRLRFESLEARRVLATYFVDTVEDTSGGVCAADNIAGNNACSIRDAISAARTSFGEDRIEIPAGTYVLTQGRLDVDAAGGLQIAGTGTGAPDVVIDGNGDRAFFVFDTGSGTFATFSNMTIQNGVAGLSPGDDDGGGAILGSSGVALSISNIVFEGNSSKDFSQGGFNVPGAGGAIQTDGSLDITDSLFRNNTADAFGGAIYFLPLFANNTLSISATSFISNTAGVDGGAIYAAEDTSLANNSSVSLSSTTFDQNVSNDSGGGVFLVAVTNVDITDSTFTTNSAQGLNGSDGVGGGLYIRRTVDDGIGGGVRISGTSFSANRALTAGAGAFIANSSTSIVDSNFTSNVVFGNGTTFLTGGGGLSVQSDELDGSNFARSSTVLTRTNVLQNTAPAGGGISVVDATLSVTNSDISSNTATEAASGGGGIGAVRTTASPTPSQNDVTVASSTIKSNTTAGAGGGIGALDANVLVTDSTVDSNQSVGPGGGMGLLGQFLGPQLTVERTTVSNNSSTQNGGGLGVIDAQLTVFNATISDNLADNTGGGIAYENSNTSFSASVTSSTIASNSAGMAGSNVAVASSVMRFLSTIIADPQGTSPAFNFVSFPGTIASQGFNLVSDSSSSFASATDLVNTDPMLGDLADNGGPVFTRALLAGSPAIDAGSGASLPIDTRGLPRPVDGDGNGTATNDIGAFELQSSSGGGGTLALQNDLTSTAEDSSSISIDALANDTGTGLVIVTVSAPANGSAVINSNTIDFTPAPDFFGIDIFNYTVMDESGNTATAQVQVTVTPINDSPVVFDDRISGQPGQVIQFSVDDLFTNDSTGAANELADTLTFQFFDPNGTGSSGTTEAGGSIVLNGSQLTYTPPQRFVGNDKFFYQVTDSEGLTSDNFASVTFSVIDAQALAGALLGDPRVTISNAMLTGGDGGAGFFSEGVSEGLPIDQGIILSTGYVGRALGPNSLFGNVSGILGAPGDATLESLIGSSTSSSSTFDATILEFDIEVPFEASIGFEYIFASEEYNEFAGTEFNDVFGFFLDGRNIALVPGANIPVSVNNVNNATNSQFFIDNDISSASGSSQQARFNSQFDGFTQSMEANTGLLEPGTVYRLRLGIADVFDDIVDSAVLLRGKSLGIGSSDLGVTAIQSSDTVPLSGTVTFAYTVSNNGPNVSENTVFSSSLSVGASIVSAVSSRGSVAATNSGITVDIADLESGEQVLIEVVVSAPDTDSLLVSQSNVSASQTDPVFINNALTRTVIVGNGPSSGSQLSGHVFCDANGNGSEEANELTSGATVFIDLNGNRLFDTGEPNVLTDSVGDYQFNAIAPGVTTVALVLPDACHGLPTQFGTVVSSFSIGSLPRDLEAADFDGDGDVDLLVANDRSNSITILDNLNGDLIDVGARIDFGANRSALRPQSLAALSPASGPAVVAVAAFGSPSASDSASLESGTGFVYRIQGSQVESFSMGDGPIDVAIADFNNDGLPDIVSAASRSSDFHLLLGGSKTPQTIGALDNAISVTTGDFDGDGNQDIAIAGYGRLNLPNRDRLPGQIQVLLGDGHGEFTDAGVTRSFNQPVDLRAADLNTGGGDELIVLGYLGELAVFSLGSSGVVQTSNIALAKGVRKIEIGEVNRDGLLDVVIVNPSTEVVTLLRGDGLGGLIVTKELRPQSSELNRAPSDVAFGAFRSGAADELVVAYSYQQTSSGGLSATSSTTLVRLGIGQATAIVSSTTNASVNFTPTTRLDVDGNQVITAGDALAVIAEMSVASAEGEQFPVRTAGKTAADVNHDGYVSAIDALMIINYLNLTDAKPIAESEQPTMLFLSSTLNDEIDDGARMLELLIEDQLRLQANS